MKRILPYQPLFLLVLLASLSIPAKVLAQAPMVFLPYVSGGENAEVIAYTDSVFNEAPATQPERIIPISVQEMARNAGENSVAPAVDIRLPNLDLALLLEEDRTQPIEQKARRIGVVRQLPEVASAAGGQGSGWLAAQDGGHYWTLTLESPDAEAIRVHLESVQIPAGGHVMVYNPMNPTESFGPYRQQDLTEESDLWTESIFASVVTVEQYVPAGIDTANVPQLEIREISHQYVDFLELMYPKEGSCHNDVMCSTAWALERDAVAGMGTIGAGAAIWCTGTLLNDFDNATFEDYFLTANHCLSGNSSDLGTQAQASSIEFYWRFQTNTCNGTVPNLANVPRTAGGADLISRTTRNSGNDHALLRIRRAAPGGVAYSGWTTVSVAVNASLGGIHHPDGAFKRISFGKLDGSSTNYWDVEWTDGVTEPGSSGSALFNSDRRLIGQLWGGGSSCANPSDLDYYGRFNVTYPSIERWMLIGGTINVNSGYTGTQLGTPTKPFRTATAANNFAWDGVRLQFKAGSYPGVITFDTPMTLITAGGTVTIGD